MRHLASPILLTCLLTASVGASGCADDGLPIRTGTFAWYQEPCYALAWRMCPVLLVEGGDRIVVRGEHPGLTPTWGTEVDTRYRFEQGYAGTEVFDNYLVDEVLATRTVAVGATATWQMANPSIWPAVTTVDDHVQVLDVPVACEPAVCAQLLDLDADDAISRYDVDVVYTGDAAMPVRAVAARRWMAKAVVTP
ncbi:MAG: hypothetical protein R3B06_27660 [Kofleriaceae bacterium]